MVQAAVGTTSTGAVDPVAEIAPMARSTEPGCTSMRPGPASPPSAPSIAGSRGVEDADSYVTNPHKWLLTTFD